jgi:hypothetical protein
VEGRKRLVKLYNKRMMVEQDWKETVRPHVERSSQVQDARCNLLPGYPDSIDNDE